jgi:NAD-dependent SIR2 family protein deacetylase
MFCCTRASSKAGLHLGNTATPTGDGVWEWRIFLRAGDTSQHIIGLSVQLHPTFTPSKFDYSRDSFDEQGVFTSQAFTGWGTFAVGLTIKWRSGASTQLSHGLVLEEGGASAVMAVAVPAVPMAMGCSPGQLSRGELQARLVACPRIKPKEGTAFFHGRAFRGAGSDQAPVRRWESKLKPRDDHDAPDWLTATEFEDTEATTADKCDMLVSLLKASRRTVVYSGAGISVAACIGQAAVGSGGEGRKGIDALPTKTHYALASLAKHGLLHGWVQQNHDGLPQKAGFPQESINEIHGSWFDPSNPVVLYSGSLKSDTYPWMKQEAARADLVLVIGTSLGGLNADQVAWKASERSTIDKPWQEDGKGGALGTVLINLQQTVHDGDTSLRMFGTTDSILSRVVSMIGIGDATPCSCGASFCQKENNGYMYSTLPRQLVKPTRDAHTHRWDLLLPDANGDMSPPQPAKFPVEPVVTVPYDSEGKKSNVVQMQLDLRDGAKVKLTAGHNVQGAGQPAFLHIGASEPYTRPKAYGGKTMRQGPGHGEVKCRSEKAGAYMLSIEGVIMELGVWWLEAAVRGQLESLPIVNIQPTILLR